MNQPQHEPSNAQIWEKLSTIERMLQEIAQKPEIVKPFNREWFSAKDAYLLIGVESPEKLRRLVRSGVFRKGIEARDIRNPESSVSQWQFHIDKCKERLSFAPEKRNLAKLKRAS